VSTPLEFANFLSPVLNPAYARLAAFVAAQLGQSVQFGAGASFDAIANGRTQAGLMCGLAYLRLREATPTLRPVAAPVLLGPRYGGRAVYFSDLVVRAAAEYAGLADLRGSRFACNEQASHSGFNVVAYTLLQRNERLPFFGEVVQTGAHVDSLRAVATGSADVAAIDSQLLDVLRRRGDRMVEGLRILDSLGPSTSPPLVVHTRLTGCIGDLQSALLRMHLDAEHHRWLRDAGISHFVAASDDSYADIARMRADAGRVTLRDLAARC
jgi:phosphonate transport system substrate-binding protein